MRSTNGELVSGELHSMGHPCGALSVFTDAAFAAHMEVIATPGVATCSNAERGGPLVGNLLLLVMLLQSVLGWMPVSS